MTRGFAAFRPERLSLSEPHTRKEATPHVAHLQRLTSLLSHFSYKHTLTGLQDFNLGGTDHKA